MSNPSDDSRLTRIGQRFTRFIRRPDIGAGLGVFLTLLVIVVGRNLWIFQDRWYEGGDFAVNSILIDKALNGVQLYGNYSRIGFHHPGPALLYVQAFGEQVFYHWLGWVPTPFNGHTLGIVIFDAAMCGCVAAILVRELGRRSIALFVLFAALTISAVQPAAIVSTSFPEIYIWPFFLLVVSAGLVFAGHVRYLPMVTLALGFLCHGHVSFFMYAGVFGLAIAVRLVALRPRRSLKQPLLYSAAIAAFFALPFVLHTLIDWPGEIDKYIKYSNSDAAGGHSWPNVLRFAASYWGANSSMGYILAACLLVIVPFVARSAARNWSPILFGLGVSCWIATITFLIYAKRGVDNLSFRYVGEYFVTVPVVILLSISLVLFVRLDQGRARTMLLIGAVACLGLAASPKIPYGAAGVGWVPDAEEAVSRAVGDQTQVVRFEISVWPWTAGVIEEGRRSGRDVCIQDPNFAFLFDSSMICDEEQIEEGVVVSYTPPGEPFDNGVAEPAYSNDLVQVLVESDD